MIIIRAIAFKQPGGYIGGESDNGCVGFLVTNDERSLIDSRRSDLIIVIAREKKRS